jgi:hypothetical protein
VSLSRWRCFVRAAITLQHTIVASVVDRVIQSRSGGGNVTTNYRTGTKEMSSSTRLAAASAILRAPHDGQKPRPLQEKATSLSTPQVGQQTRPKPQARMPQRRKPSNSWLTRLKVERDCGEDKKDIRGKGHFRGDALGWAE